MSEPYSAEMIAMVRKHNPEGIAKEICSVQPLPDHVVRDLLEWLEHYSIVLHCPIYDQGEMIHHEVRNSR